MEITLILAEDAAVIYCSIKTPDAQVGERHMLQCLRFSCHLHVCSCISFPACIFKKYKYAATSAHYSSSFLTSFSILFQHSQTLLPQAVFCPRRVSALTSWIWSTVDVLSHSFWIIKLHSLFCCSHIWSSKSPHEYSADWFWWLGPDCLRNHYFIKKNERDMIEDGKKRGRWFINIQ